VADDDGAPHRGAAERQVEIQQIGTWIGRWNTRAPAVARAPREHRTGCIGGDRRQAAEVVCDEARAALRTIERVGQARGRQH
jgi:hypothetical protein